MLIAGVMSPLVISNIAHAASGTLTSGPCTSYVNDTTSATLSQVSGTNDCLLTFTTGASSQTTSITNSWTVPNAVREIQFLLIGGGGPGGDRTGGGGGAGGYVYMQNVAVRPSDSIPITVGGGGVADAPNVTAQGTNGSNSTIGIYNAAGTATSFTAVGGGAGYTTYGVVGAGKVGGSAGGSGGTYTGAAQSQTAQNYGNGNNGATGVTGNATDNTWSGGGGGGAGGPGSSGDLNQNSSTGKGGNGILNSITGSAVCYAAGGGAGVGGGTPGLLNNGGSCGGSQVGGSGSLSNYAASNPVANTGSGGGGSGFVTNPGDGQASNGAGGILIIRWTIPGNVGAFPNIAGLVARFNAANFNNASNMNGGLGTWADTSGSGFHVTGSNISGTAMTTGTNSGNGASGSFPIVSGVGGTSSASSSVQFLSTTQLPYPFTIFNIARYQEAYNSGWNNVVNNQHRGRILQGIAGNSLFGFWGGLSGVSFHENWLTQSTADVYGSNWVLSADCWYDASPVTNSCSSRYHANNSNLTTVTNITTAAASGSDGLGLNGKGAFANETSNFQLADILVFNRVLTFTELNSIDTYLGQRYGITLTQQVPTAPTSLSSSLSNGTATVSFTNSTATSTVTNYEYSTDGITYTPFNPVITSSPATITSIPNGITNLYLKAINAYGEGSASSLLQIVNGAAVPVALSVSGSNFQFQHTGTLNLVATLTGSNGVVTFYYNNKKVFRCTAVQSVAYVATCPWKPSAHGTVWITATAAPSNTSYVAGSASPMQMFIGARSYSRG
jgi:hypothetical protein